MRVDVGLHGAELGFLLLDHELPFLQLGILDLPDQPLQLSRHAVEAVKHGGHFIVAEPVHVGRKHKIPAQRGPSASAKMESGLVKDKEKPPTSANAMIMRTAAAASE